MPLLRYSLVIALLLSCSLSAFSQNKKAFFQLGVSANSYKGDLQESYDKLSSGFHFGVRVHGDKRVNGGLLFHAGSLTGQNVRFVSADPSITPNSFFKTRLLSGQFNLNINIIKKDNFRLFISQGIGLLNFQPENDLGEQLLDLPDTRSFGESYTNNALILPTALGVLYTLKNGFGLALRFTYLNPQTDYLDNISTLGPDDNNDRVFQTNLTLLVPFNLPSPKSAKSSE
ncbi:MAG: outer membrane beta-barrel protein [Flammeovirgaceae bacterium]